MISVGIDVSKGSSTVCILKPNGEVLAAPHEMLHTKAEIFSLAQRLNGYDEEVRVILEATGHYHWPVVALLMENNIFISCVNALRMKRYCSQNIRKGKTDRIDSVQIARYGITYWSELVAYKPSCDTYAELRTFSRQYHQYQSLLVKAKINLGTLLDQTMPGIKELLADKHGRHKLTDFVSMYWHFDNIRLMSEKSFVGAFIKWGKKEGYRQNESKAKAIYTLSQSGIPTLPCTQVTKFLVQEAVRILHQIEKSYNAILSHMQLLASSLPEYDVVIDMNGVGPALAPQLIAEIGDVRRFHNKNALVAYAGIDAPPYQSGAFSASKRSISKRGNKILRKVGFETMQAIVCKKPTFDDAVYRFILKKMAEGKNKNSAKIAGLNKFLRIYYARVTEVYRLIRANSDSAN